jgi:hypothetical protein
MDRAHGVALVQEDRMRLLMVVMIAMPLGTTPAAADDVPARKPGLWEVKTSIGNTAQSLTMKQCIDAATDQLMQPIAGPFSAQVCPKRSVQRADGTITIDSTCSVAGKTATARAVVTGSFDSSYTMTVTAQGAALPTNNVSMTVDAKWLGACAEGQKPGDMIMGNGMTVNLLELQKHATSPNPLPSH